MTSMRYTSFGRRTGLRVSELALGTGNFGTAWASGADMTDSRAIFDRFAEAGGTFLDTAAMYQGGQSESMLGDMLTSTRDDFVVSSKYGLGNPEKNSRTTNGVSRKAMIASVEASLRRLGTDYLDIFWVHFPDAFTPTDEILRGLDDLVRAGKIHHGALSNFPAWRIALAAKEADLRSWAPIVAIQTEYSLAERGAENELLPMAEALGLGVNLWSPLAGGLLTGKYRDGAEGRKTDPSRWVADTSAQTTAVIDTVLQVAAETGASAAQVSMAWLRERGNRSVTAVVPIIGPRTMAQLEDYLGALDVELTRDQYQRLDDVSAPGGEISAEINEMTRGAMLDGEPDRFILPTTPVV
ncbi:aldo/keto reductase [Frondihabitans sp. 4ASC-45]|uniref:aldo/keto reductase n=1 Tax=Frondihabitans sp. 4ASC-45 TaxID=3111636 RepID=UPI003C23D389